MRGRWTFSLLVLAATGLSSCHELLPLGPAPEGRRDAAASRDDVARDRPPGGEPRPDLLDGSSRRDALTRLDRPERRDGKCGCGPNEMCCNNTCYPAGWQECQGTCCAPSYTCCQGTCCPGPTCCAGVCCGDLTICCGQTCCPVLVCNGDVCAI